MRMCCVRASISPEQTPCWGPSAPAGRTRCGRGAAACGSTCGGTTRTHPHTSAVNRLPRPPPLCLHARKHTHLHKKKGQHDKEWDVYRCLLHAHIEFNFSASHWCIIGSISSSNCAVFQVVLLNKVVVWHHGDEERCHGNNRCYDNVLHSILNFV